MLGVEIVTGQDVLEAHCAKWRAAGCFAFDTEFIRDHTYKAKLCLVQVAAGSEVVLVDPTEGLDLEPFWSLLTDEEVATVVHAGKADCELCLQATGKPPRNVFDVQIAAGFLGYGYPANLMRLVSDVVGEQIEKGQSVTDWLRRPLTPAQLRYAVDDVAHLPAIRAELGAGLERAGRTAWAEEECRQLEDPELYRPPTRGRLFRLKGTKRLDGLGLALVERLIQWRERWAEERNRPVRTMMRDDVLVEIARTRPKGASDLEVLRGFPQARNPKVVRQVLQIIKETSTTPPTEWPEPYRSPEELPMAKVMLDVMSAVLRAECHEQKVSHDLVGSAQRLRELLDYSAGRGGEPPALLSGWRERFIGRRLQSLLDGRCELRVCGWPEAPRLEVSCHPRPAPGLTGR